MNRATAISESPMLERLGLVPYATAQERQRATAQALAAGAGPECLFLLQHPPTFTIGRHGGAGAGRVHLLASEADLAVRGAIVVDTDRGGDITFHGPGQLVAYPILHLRHRGVAAGDYVRRLESVVIETLSAFGLGGRRVPGRPGVWLGNAKVAAIGVRVSGGVSRHGLALNVDPDLSWFDAIVPCGIADASVTSMARVLGAAPCVEEVEEALARAFRRHFPDGEGGHA